MLLQDNFIIWFHGCLIISWTKTITFIAIFPSQNPIVYQLHHRTNHTNVYLKHDYNGPHTYNKLQSFVSYLIGSLAWKYISIGKMQTNRLF